MNDKALEEALAATIGHLQQQVDEIKTRHDVLVAEHHAMKQRVTEQLARLFGYLRVK